MGLFITWQDILNQPSKFFELHVSPSDLSIFQESGKYFPENRLAIKMPHPKNNRKWLKLLKWKNLSQSAPILHNPEGNCFIKIMLGRGKALGAFAA